MGANGKPSDDPKGSYAHLPYPSSLINPPSNIKTPPAPIPKLLYVSPPSSAFTLKYKSPIFQGATTPIDLPSPYPSSLVSPVPTQPKIPSAPKKLIPIKSAKNITGIPFPIPEGNESQVSAPKKVQKSQASEPKKTDSSKKLCSKKSKNAKSSQYVCNPESGKWIEIDGPTYKKLLKKYTKQELSTHIK